MTATLVAVAPATAATEDGDTLASVQVWFAGHLIADWTGPADKAPAIARHWDQRWGGGVQAPGVEW